MIGTLISCSTQTKRHLPNYQTLDYQISKVFTPEQTLHHMGNCPLSAKRIQEAWKSWIASLPLHILGRHNDGGKPVYCLAYRRFLRPQIFSTCIDSNSTEKYPMSTSWVEGSRCKFHGIPRRSKCLSVASAKLKIYWDGNLTLLLSCQRLLPSSWITRTA